MNQYLKSTPVFVLAGGRGERLGPLTESKPKPAIPFGGDHQIIDFTLSNCINSGLRRIYILTQYNPEPLHDYVGEIRMRMACHSRSYSDLCCLPPPTDKQYKGTADAVFQNTPLVRFDSAEHVLVVSADHVYSMDYTRLLEHHAASGADMTIAAIRKPIREASMFGVLDTTPEGQVVGFREKPSAITLPPTGSAFVSMGIYVFRKSALLDLADGSCNGETDFGKHIVPALIRSGKVAAFDFGEERESYWRDVGTIDSYYEASMDLLGRNPLFRPPDPFGGSRYGTGIQTSCNSRISLSARTEGSQIYGSVICENACVEPGAVVLDSVVLPGVRIGRHARVRSAILSEGAAINPAARIGEDLRTDRLRFLVTPRGIVVVSETLRKHEDRTRSREFSRAVPLAA